MSVSRIVKNKLEPLPKAKEEIEAETSLIIIVITIIIVLETISILDTKTLGPNFNAGQV